MSTEAIASRPSLPDLPNEILTLIFDHLFDGQRRQARLHARDRKYSLSTTYASLYSLARTCRTLSHVARDILRQKFVWEFRHPFGPFAQGARPGPYHHTYPDCRHIKVLSDAEIDGRPLYEGPPKEALESALMTQRGWPDDVRHILAEALEGQPAAVELALVVANSPNLREFIMDARHATSRFGGFLGDAPIWLYPIIQVAQRNLIKSVNNPFYNELRTIDINMQNGACYSLTVACLFVLPSLRKLRLSVKAGVWSMLEGEDWPIQERSSSVSTLILHRVKISAIHTKLMIMSCKELSRFEYVRDSSNDSLRGLPEIMSGLEQQQDKLRILRLDFTHRDPRDAPDLNHARIDGFHRLYALEKLTTSFQILLGRPSMDYTGDGGWQYPQIRDVLPHGLQELSLGIKSTTISHKYHEGFYRLFSSALPLQTNGLRLKRVHVAYSDRKGRAPPLPFSFWDIKDLFVAHGVKFDYRILIHTNLGGK